MNLENYTCKSLVAVKNCKNGKFAFCCEATNEGVKACRALMLQANEMGLEYEMTFFSTYIKNPTIQW